jgi:DNA adenine methylase
MIDITIESKKQIETKVGISVKPFLRWAGGKQNLVKILNAHLPSQPFNNYFEPFLGAGSLFLSNGFPNSLLSDINPHLINSYSAIKDSPEELNSKLIYHKKRVSEEYYYKLRERFNKKKNQFDIDQAAVFIFLIHTSFNGIFRVNREGNYNVPFGKIKPALPGLDHLLQIQSNLKGSKLQNCMYEDILEKVGKSDFVYFDPPYPPLNETSFFQHYTINKFPESQQHDLARNAMELSDRGAFVMISNAETPAIKKLYKGWNINVIKAYRYINCKSERKTVNELIITNY